MIKPKMPADELKRMETLRNLKILDTPPEERFDRVTRMAQRVFGTPIALVSIVDENRQWFKSRQGLEATETPREISFCGHAILENKIMVVADASKDERFNDNPLVTEDPNIRFYAGYPIGAPDGTRMGTLCVIDDQPREFSKDDLRLLRELGQMVEEEFITTALSTTDAVTGLSNFYGFEMLGSKLLKVCERLGQSLSLLMYRFEVSDASQADVAATEVAHMLLSTFRESDVVARLSSDVYVVLLAGVDLHGAQRAQERFEETVSARNREPMFGRELQLDFELQHVAYKPARHKDLQALVDDAAQRLADSTPLEEVEEPEKPACELTIL